MTAPDRLPPHNPDTERAVLGCVMLSDEGTINECAERGVSHLWFYNLAHQQIFAAMVALADDGVPVDTITLSEKLRGAGQLESAGGMAFLSSLPDAVVSATELPHYLDLLENHYRMRRLVAACGEAVARVYEPNTDPDSLVSDLTRAVLRLEEDSAGVKEQPIKPILIDVVDQLEKYHAGTAQITGITTGIPIIDKQLLGMGGDQGNFLVVSGRPGTGKTSFATDVALHVALDYQWFTPKLGPDGKQLMDGKTALWDSHRGVPVGVFSLEMNRVALVKRMLFQRGKADMQTFRTGFASKADIVSLIKSSEELGKAPIWIDDTPRCTIGEVKAKARRWIRQYGIRLFVLDYIQLMRADGRRFRDDRVQELAEISGELQRITKELGVPWIILAQMNRDYEKDPKRQPRLSDLKDCGAIEQDADLVAFLYQPKLKEDKEAQFDAAIDAVYGKDKSGNWSKLPMRVDFLVAKNRYGPTGHCELLFHKSSTRFEDYFVWLKSHGQKELAAGESKSNLPSNEELYGQEEP